MPLLDSIARRYGPRIAPAMTSVGRRALGFSGMGKTGAIAAGAYIGYKGVKGFTDQVVPNAIDNAMDVAFGDPQADRAVLGTDLTPSMLYMNSGLPGRSIAIARNLSRTGVNTGPVGAAIPPMLGIGGGAAAGAIVGSIGGFSPKIGAAIGGAIGGAVGTAITGNNIIGTAARNRQILSESPFYNQSLLTAQRLNASGNIVLGMHNQRRG